MNTQDFRKKLLDWYTAHQRRLPWRETTDPYAIWVSEVMLQQTRVDTALSYYLRFLDRFPTPVHLAEANIQTVLKLWEGLGYYSRARNLHRAAGIVVSQFDGRIPDDPDTFQSLPGVGDYTCAAVLSIAFGRALPVVDGNVKRVLARLMEIDTPVNRSDAHKVFQDPAAALLCSREPANFNQAIMELGALLCQPREPRCDACPVSGFCSAYRNKTTTEFPKRIPPKKTPRRHHFICVIRKKEKMLVVQRPLEGFLGGLWEFPSVPDVTLEPRGRGLEKMMKKETGLTIEVDRKLTRIRHAYTHFRLTGDVYLCRYVKGRIQLRSAVAHRWATLGSLTRLPMHKANHKFLGPLAASLK